MNIISGGQGNVGPSDQTTPHTPHTSPILSTEKSATHSMTSPRAAEGAANVSPPTTDDEKEGVDVGLDRDVDAFTRYSHVTSTVSIVCTFLVNEKLVPIKIERILGHYRYLFSLSHSLDFDYGVNPSTMLASRFIPLLDFFNNLQLSPFSFASSRSATFCLFPL